jgi:hypothetical protein
MLPLIYTRTYLLGLWEAKRRKSSSNAMIYSAENNLYAVRRVQTACPPATRSVLRFACEMTHGDRRQKVFMGIMDTEALGLETRSPGIGFAIDLFTGLVTDLVNDQGVLGYLENIPTAGHATRVEIEVEVIGDVYIPQILVGKDIITHPALILPKRDSISAVLGTSVHPLGDATFANARFQIEPAAKTEVLSPIESA